MLKIFFKDSIIYTLSAFLSRGLSVFLVPLYTRVLSPADYGSLDFLLIFASIVNLTIALEVSQGVARFYTAESNLEAKIAYASTGFWFTLVCYSVFALLMLFLSPYVATFIMGGPGHDLAFQIGIAYIWSNGLFYLIQNQFRWEFRSKDFTVISLLMVLVSAAISVWLAYFQNLGLNGLLIGMTTGCLTVNVLGLYLLRNSFQCHFDMQRLKEMLSFSTPLIFSGIAVWITWYVDRLMINYFLSIEQVGLYGIGFRLASITVLVIVGFQGALTPLIYKHYQNPDTPRQLEQMFRLFIAFALLIFLATVFFAIDILTLMTTPSFYGGADVVIFLVPAILLSNMYIFSPGISIAKKTHLIIWINVLAALLNILLNYLLIPKMGIKGAGMATMLSCLVLFSAYTVVGNRYYPIPHNWGKIFIAVAFAGTLALIVPHLVQNDFLLRALYIAVLCMFPFMLIAIGLVRRDELSTAWQIVQKKFSSTLININIKL